MFLLENASWSAHMYRFFLFSFSIREPHHIRPLWKSIAVFVSSAYNTRRRLKLGLQHAESTEFIHPEVTRKGLHTPYTYKIFEFQKQIFKS